MLRFLVHGATQSVKFLAAYEVHSICTVDAVAIEMRVIEEHPAEVIRQHDVRIEVHPPAVVLEAIKAGVDGGTFVELAAVLAEEIGLHADRAMFFGDLLRGFVVVRGDDNHRVEMRMIEAEAHIEEIIKTDAGGDGFEAERLGSAEREITLRISGHGGRGSLVDARQPMCGPCELAVVAGL